MSDYERLSPTTREGYTDLQVCAVCGADVVNAPHTIWTNVGLPGDYETIALCAECDAYAEPTETLAELQERIARKAAERAERRRRYAEEHFPEEDQG
jgi:hypothetical protein